MSEKSEILMRGFCLRCPKCGKGKLLRRFIIPLKQCTNCQEDFEPLRADDGPAWATILITGHIIVPLSYSFLSYDDHALWQEMSATIIAALALSALILPRAKGVFMALIWMSRQKIET